MHEESLRWTQHTTKRGILPWSHTPLQEKHKEPTQPITRSTRGIPSRSHNPSLGAHEESLPGHTTHHQEHTRNPSLVTQPITRSTQGIPPWSHNPSLGAHKESLPGHTTHHQEHTRNPSLVTQPMTRSTRGIPPWSHITRSTRGIPHWSHNPSQGAHEESLPGHTTHH